MKNNSTQPMATSQSMAASFNSAALSFYYQTLGAIQAVWTGSPQGTIKLQFTNDQNFLTNSGALWTDISDSTVDVSLVTSWGWLIQEFGGVAVRTAFTRTGGSGSVTIVGNVKGD